MITDCLARDRRLAVVGLKPGYEGDYDGKPPVRGGRRRRQHRPVRAPRQRALQHSLEGRACASASTARSRPTRCIGSRDRRRRSTTSGADRPALPTLADTIRERCLQILEALGRGGAEMRESLEAVQSPAELGDQVASAVIPDAAVRRGPARRAGRGAPARAPARRRSTICCDSSREGGSVPMARALAARHPRRDRWHGARRCRCGPRWGWLGVRIRDLSEQEMDEHLAEARAPRGLRRAHRRRA